jgi:branched-chain amino acid transport system substrate-binding protein
MNRFAEQRARGAVALGCAVIASFWLGTARAEEPPLRIGLGIDLSGPSTDNSGPHTVAAVQMAIDDFGGTILGRKIELLVGNDLSKPDLGSAIARQWIAEDKVDTILAASTSATTLAVLNLASRNQIPVEIIGAGSSDLTGKDCTAFSTQWIWDTYSLSKSVVAALTARGMNTWYLVTVDYSFGKAIESDLRTFVAANGGKVVGVSRHPLGATDLSAFILQAQASQAKVIAAGDTTNDLVNLIKGMNEFDVAAGGQTLAALAMSITQIHTLGLAASHDLQITTPFYHDMTDETRAWSKRLMARDGGHLPNMIQSGAYSATLQYLKAVAAAGTTAGPAVMAKLHVLPVDDFEMKDVHIRQDGQVMRPMYLVRVKKPSESKFDYDYYDVEATVPAEQAWRPLAESACPLLTSN